MHRLAGFPLLAFLALLPSAHAEDVAETLFELKIRPILVDKCFPCHGGAKTKGGLRVDSREALLKGGNRGPAIVPGDVQQSLLIRAINRTDEDLRMPPAEPLREDLRSALVEWVAQGARWPKVDGGIHFRQSATAVRHWAFEPVTRVEPPPDPDHWSDRPIDRFIAARRHTAGVSHASPANKRTLIRRVTFDLIGLPPTPMEVEEFLGDDSPDALSRVVERLLASPHYGERWGRYWMDVVRYADTAGDNADYPIPESARYRDYIIDSFNKDKPYDRFIREQLAGDILARQERGDRYAESIIATGFIALSRRYATAPFELWHLTIEDAIDTTGRAFLGLTFRCARCHDHKFDPVTQRDYYALYGVFASTAFPYAGSEEFHSKKTPRSSFVPLLKPEQAEPRLRSYQSRMSELARKIRVLEASKDQKERQRLPGFIAELARLKRPSLPVDLPGAYAVTDGEPINVALQRQGDPANPGEVIPRGTPRFAFLAGRPARSVSDRGSGRLELSNWIADPANPLTARVMVNRVWQHHFGQGIVPTPSNFGTRGEPPTDPELLDWLAATFVDRGWSIKEIHREIVLSQTYQLASDFDPANAAVDPANRWLWRYPRRRLDAEAIRDATLAVSGELNTQPDGSHPFPPIDQWHWTQHDAFKAVYPTNHRTVYMITQRLVKHPYLSIFDGPDTNTSADVRTRSTVPLQALYLMNSTFTQHNARCFAARVLAASTNPRERVRHAYQLAWGRPPEPAESERSIGFVEKAMAVLSSQAACRESREEDAWTSLAKVLLTANEFLYID